MNTTHRENWASRFGFIMATAGYSIGLGNIWRFPYTTGMNGGGAFLLVYLAFAILIGIPLMTAEVSLGRKAQLSPFAGMSRLTGSNTNPWNAIAWLGCTTAVVIQSYYLMLIGWVFGYFVMIVSGSLNSVPVESLPEIYQQFISTPGPVFGYTLLTVVLMGLVVSRGLGTGLERLAKFAMPLLFVLLVGMAIRSLTFPGASEGLRWFLTPDFSAINAQSVLAALGQAFYSIGIGMGAAFAFGSYLKAKTSDVPGNVAIVVCCDTLIAFIAGLVIFPALFAFSLEPDAGPGLLFVTMTSLFAQMPGGYFFGSLFFFLLILAAITSAVALHEVLTATVADSFKIHRRIGAWLIAGICLILATPVILSQGPWSHIRFLDMDLFVLLDTVSGSFLLPATALAISLYVVFSWTFDRFRDETNIGSTSIQVTAIWKPFVVIAIPIAVSIVLLMGLGLL